MAGGAVTATGGPRRELAARLAEKCRRHHLVVWDDPARQYESVVDAVVPEGWALERYTGSWWDLRRRIEPAFSGSEPPKLVVYLPAAAPVTDPLEEVRKAGFTFKRLLPTVLKDALVGEVTASRIADLSARCPTLAAAEAALQGGADLDPILIAEIGSKDAEGAITSMLLGSLDLSPDARVAVATLVRDHLGATVGANDNSDDLSRSLGRHLVLAAIGGAASDRVVSGVVPSWEPPSAQQRRHAAEIVDHACRPATMAAWGERADAAAAELGLEGLGWHPGLERCDVARFLDGLAFDEASRLLSADHKAAARLAATRLEHSRWLHWRDTSSAHIIADLEAVRSVARLHQRLADHPVPSLTSLADLYRWYADGGWRVDRAHRLMEGARYAVRRAGLDTAFTDARRAYLDWLDALLVATNRAACASAETNLTPQADIVPSQVLGRQRTALVIVDALRLEIGHRLAELVRGPGLTASVNAAVTLPPTITPVGMANLLPGAERGLTLSVKAGALAVGVAGKAIRAVEDRTAEYRRAAGRVEDHRLADWLGLGDDVFAQRVADADLAIVRSQEIDAAGESGLTSVRWSQIDAATDLLAILVGRLVTAGIQRVIVTADHGFLALGRPLDPSCVRPVPTGLGVPVHGRAWVGQPAIVPDGCSSLPLSDFGVESADSIVLPDGMTVFGAAGAGFFHGGISPQEAVIPVVAIDASPAGGSAADLLSVAVEVPGGRISAEAFSAKVTLAGSLFAADVAIRITAADDTGRQVARLVPSDAVDARTGTVRLDPGTDAILTFLVSEALDKDRRVEVAVLDARSGRRLSVTTAVVARELRPEEGW